MSENAQPPIPSVETDANEADVQEQSMTVDDVDSGVEASGTDEVDEFDAAEQGRVVPLDPDEYR